MSQDIGNTLLFAFHASVAHRNPRNHIIELSLACIIPANEVEAEVHIVEAVIDFLEANALFGIPPIS